MILIYYLTTATTMCNILSMTTNTNKNKQRVTLFINPQVLVQAKAQAIIENLTLTSLTEKALVSYLPVETVIKKVRV